MSRLGWASFVTGFLLSFRWVMRGLGPWCVVAAAVVFVAVSSTFGTDVASRRSGWIELVMLGVPLVAAGSGAYACRVLRGRTRAFRLEGAPVHAFFFVLGQVGALGLFVAASAGVFVLPALLVFPHSLEPARTPCPPRSEGRHLRDYGRSWAVAPTGGFVWSFSTPARGDWRFEGQLTMARVAAYQGDLPRVRLCGAGLDRVMVVEPERPFSVVLPDPGPDRTLSLVCETPGWAVAPVPGSVVLLAGTRAAAVKGWLQLWWVAAAQGLFLFGVALAVALVASPPVALLASLTAWLAGWAAQFLREFSAVANVPSVFTAWAGEGGEASSPSWLLLLGKVINLLPDARGTSVLDALGRGRLTGWGSVWIDSVPVLAVVLATGLIAASLAFVLWTRRPGRFPGERWFS